MSGHWFCRPPNVTRDQPQPPVRSVHDFIQRIGHTLPCLGLWSQAGALNPHLKMYFPQSFVLSQHLWEISGDFFRIYFWAFFRASCFREEEKANSATWKSFHLAIPAALTQGWGGTGGEEGRGNLPTNPMPTISPHWEGEQLLPILAAQVLPQYQPGCQGQVASQAGRINKRWSVRLCFSLHGFGRKAFNAVLQAAVTVTLGE